MKVAPGKQSSPKGQTEKPSAQPFTFPAPIRGLVLNENLSQIEPGGARILNNWVCTTTGIRVRGGCRKFATVGDAVTALFTHRSGGIETFFAATESDVYNITSPASPTTVPTADLTGQSGGAWSSVQFGTAGGDFLVIANGTDNVQNFDGAAWSAPAITGVDPADLSQVWSFANRLFFVEGGTLNCWYLPVDSIAGAASEFSLSGVFKRGGALLFGGTWSLDAGDGLDDKCVFVSDQGEVAIYEGTNPGSAADWRKVGVYQIPKPMGKNASLNAGGDLLIATETGLIPVSASVRNDIAAVQLAAVSMPISPLWYERSKLLGGYAWEMLKIAVSNILVISQPSTNTCLVANLQTGAWSQFTGWDVRCLGLFVDDGYFGASDSCVYAIEQSGADNETPYTCTYLGNSEAMGLYGQQKRVLQMRAGFTAQTPFVPQLSACMDYSEDILSPPSSPADYADGWDAALWDVALWDAVGAQTSQSRWVSIGKTGGTVAPELQLTFGLSQKPLVELVAIDAQFMTGAVVT